MGATNSRTTADQEREREDWPGIVGFVILCGSILGVLLLGAALRTDPPAGEFSPPEAAVEIPLDPEGDALELEAEEPLADFLPPESLLDRMARRAGADVERLAASPDGWTAQVGLFCDPERVRQLVEGFGDRPALLVLPSYHADRPCFRICWNRYPAREGALRATDMPRALRALLEGDPYPRRVTEVLE